MNVANLQPPLTNVQVELLKLFATQLSDTHLVELKNMIARFLLEKARDRADQIWDERGYSDEKLNELLQKNG